MKERIHMPRQVGFIIDKLTEQGYEAYVVGGCVRDSVLGKVPKDWDVATSANPERVKELFPRTIDTGIEHGTVTVMMGKLGYEVTTYRIDGEYVDGRRPKEVAFTKDLLEDLKRRDFTINAMAYHPKTGIVDAFEGRKDLEEGRIRCVGEAEQRFEEDALRMLRAIRFSARLGFEIEGETAQAIRRKAGKLQGVSAERIRTEVDQIVTCAEPKRMRTAYELGLTKVFLPEFDAMMETEQNDEGYVVTVGEHAIRAVEEMGRQLEEGASKERSILCWTMLLHDVGKPSAILKRLKFDNGTVEAVTRLARWHDYRFGDDKKEVRRAVSQIGREWMDWLFLVQRADARAHNPKSLKEKEERIRRAQAFFCEFVQNGDALSIKDLAVNGRDLLELGVPEGKGMGETLRALLELALDRPERNTREELLEWVRDNKAKGYK